MAAASLFPKCQRITRIYFQVSSVKKISRLYVFSCGHRNFSSALKIPEKDKFDVVVIGGGSGGLSCAKEARALGASVCVVDYVTPSPRGSTWGMGGTCVNVGCIPKKLMHQAALLGEAIHDAEAYGWMIKDIDDVHINWGKLIGAIQNHIKSVNWVTRVDLKENQITYINGYGKFNSSPHVIEVEVKDDIKHIYGKNVVIATGGRPNYPNIPGAIEYGVTSDDIFSLPDPPGKTLVVGAGYIAVECAGFLNTFRYPVTVMVRSVVLRSFDQQMANLVKEHMIEKGVRFLDKTIPIKIEKVNNKLLVTYENRETKKKETEDFDCVLFAIGRKALTDEINVKSIDLKIDEATGKILTTDEKTNIPHIFAVGDVIYGKPELSPVAIEAGKMLARRIVQKSKEVMDYNNVATTVFTPLEYGCVGLSEEKAIAIFKEDNIEVYHSYYKPPEFSIPGKSIDQCYLKVISLRNPPRKIIGMHFVGPMAGEVIQGYAAAMKCGFTVEGLMGTVGIHPTVSEEFTRVSVTKRSGLDPRPSTCCS